jgi:hypothetical protein
MGNLNQSSLPLARSGARADPWLGPGFGVAAADQSHEFLRCRYVAAVAALLRHRTTNPYPFCFQGILVVDPRFERAVTPSQVLNDRLSGLAGRGFIANIGGATAHDCHPLLKLGHNAQPPRMVAGRSVESGAPMLRFTEAEQASSPEKLESRPGVEPV